MNKKIRLTVTASLLAALACIATVIIKIPSPMNGYINLGDCIVLISGWMLPSAYGFLAAGLGSSLADVFSGFISYAPATFVIKGLMAVIANCVFKLLKKKLGNTASWIVSGIAAEIFMILGYYVFEGSLLYGFVSSALNIPANGVQGIAGLIIGTVLIKIFEKRITKL